MSNQIKGKDLRKLGFKRGVERTKNGKIDYHYYTYEINKHCMLISNSNDERDIDGGYHVKFYEIPEVKFTKLRDLKKLLKLLKKANNECS